MPDRNPETLETIRRVLALLGITDYDPETVYDSLEPAPVSAYWIHRTALLLQDPQGVAAQIELLQAIQVAENPGMIVGTPEAERPARLAGLAYYRRRAEEAGVTPFADSNRDV